MKKISIITPCFNEKDTILECYKAIKELFSNELKKYDYEHIICDNSSQDGTQKILREIASKDKKIKIILNYRNFGEEKNTFNGIKSSSGDAVVLYFPADLQDPPNIIIDFIKGWEEGYDLVYGSRKKRYEFFILTLFRKLFYKIINIGSKKILPSNISDFQLADKRIVEEIKKIEDISPFIRSLAFFITDNHKKVEYNVQRRKEGKSKFPFFSLVNYALDGFLNINYAPFRVLLIIGIFTSMISFIYGFYLLFQSLFFEQQVYQNNYLFLISGLLVFLGIQLFLIGLIGEYLVSIHKHIKKKDVLIEKERINFDL